MMPDSTRCRFSKESIEDFTSETGIVVPLNNDQRELLSNGHEVKLTIDQLRTVLSGLCSDSTEFHRFIGRKAPDLQPFSATLFVQNDAIWKIMRKKSDYPDKLLPVVTFPLFYWSRHAQTVSNPRGIKKQEYDDVSLAIDAENKTLAVSGTGGNFCGVVEEYILDHASSSRSLIIPDLARSRKKIPRYDPAYLRITAQVSSVQTTLFPQPDEHLDYAFSESPKVFFEHGIEIALKGHDAKLKADRRPEISLLGRIKLLIGRPVSNASKLSTQLMFHVWLIAVAESLYSMSDGSNSR